MFEDSCVCDPATVDGYHYVKLIAWVFGDCVRTPTEIASFFCGLFSLSCFAVAFFPQIWMNFRRKSTDGLSADLMISWAFGDIGNLLGSFLTNQLALQLWVAAYFIMIDVITLTQIVWYGWLRVRLGLAKPVVYEEIVDSQSEDGGSNSGDQEVAASGISTSVANESTCLLIPTVSGIGGGGGGSKVSKLIANNTMAIVVLCVCLSAGMVDAGITSSVLGIDGLVSAPGPPRCDARMPVSPSNYALGCVMSWVSGLCYFFSRVSQIRENHSRKSVEGVSIGE
ncbi:hypothetical protein HDU98_001975 [Podochytrium sp. JEL0797]|nr:hypothetical protein HDU98_001975 [Podochytrium sp. JEL0797]